MSDDIHTLSGAYAVDALDDLQKAAFERHLAACVDCRAEVEGLRETAALLSSSVELTPPPALRASIVAGISEVRPEPPVQPKSKGRPRLMLLAVAAAVIAIVGTGIAVTQPWEDDTSSQPAAQSTTDRVIRADDAERHTVLMDDDAKATVVRSAKLGKAALITESMPKAPIGKTYQAWLQHADKSMTPAGLLGSPADQTVLLEGKATDAIAVGITLEPSGGSPRPTSRPLAMIELKAEGA